jgi:hypothetical protein
VDFYEQTNIHIMKKILRIPFSSFGVTHPALLVLQRPGTPESSGLINTAQFLQVDA